MTNTTNQPTTAADMAPIVEAGRAEGLSRKAIFLRYFRQARPDGHAVSDTECDTADWKLGPVWFYAFDDRHTCIITEDNEWEEVASADHETDESALAWLANQLAEHCPVAAATTREESCGRDTMIRREWQCRTALDHPESPGEYDREAARLRRMFGIVEPQEDSKEGGAE